ncbi:MAG: LemA family protein [Oscillospiraceae bacterium]|nr:LemA family protein [Oscillospiraceae bacterium]
MVPIIIISVIVLIYVIKTYNGIKTKHYRVEKAFSSIDVILQKRSDLIPNLVAVVKEYTKYEKDVLTRITELRRVCSSGNVKECAELDNEITGALKSIFAVAENYPNLKANEQFSLLQKQLTSVENELSAARRTYNAACTHFNTLITVFPRNIVAGIMREKEREFYVADNRERVDVSL